MDEPDPQSQPYEAPTKPNALLFASAIGFGKEFEGNSMLAIFF